MMKKWLVLLVVALGVTLWCGVAQASGTYYRPGATATIGRFSGLAKGQTRVGLRADFQHYGRVRMFDGNHMTVGDVRLRTYTVTAEYGVNERTSAYVALPYVYNDSETNAAPFAKESGLGDFKIGINQALQQNEQRRTTLIGTAEFTIPLRNYSTLKLTAPGDNSVDFLGRLSWRHDDVGGTPFFYTVGGGFKLRASQSPDQWLWDTELGARIGRGSVSTFLDSINSTNGFALGGPGFAGDFSTLKQTVTRWGVRTFWNFGGIDLELYYAKAIVFQNQAPFDYYGLSVAGRF